MAVMFPADGPKADRGRRRSDEQRAMAREDKTTLEELLSRLRCPRSHGPLRLDGDSLVSEDGAHRYPIEDGVPDLQVAPERMQLDLPWYEPWDELDALAFEFPDPLPAPDLPYHLDRHHARIPGEDGAGRWILEVGCGERQCEPYFNRRGFRYVGTDVDHRGPGPHLKADAHNLPFTDGSMDFYCSFAVYEHLAAPLVAAVEAESGATARAGSSSAAPRSCSAFTTGRASTT